MNEIEASRRATEAAVAVISEAGIFDEYGSLKEPVQMSRVYEALDQAMEASRSFCEFRLEERVAGAFCSFFFQRQEDSSDQHAWFAGEALIAYAHWRQRRWLQEQMAELSYHAGGER